MKRILLYCIVLITLCFIPVRGTELGKMIPVEAVYLYMEEDTLVIRTDAGNNGKGATLEQAIENLHHSAPGIIFLDTADYLLVTDKTESYISQLRATLKSSIYICKLDGEVEIEKAAQYLSVHTPSVRLKDWNKGTELEKMYVSEEQMYLEQKVTKK